MGTRYEVICDEKDRARWLRARRDGIGGSEAAAGLGVNPWSSPMNVFAEKSGSFGDPVANDRSPSEYARWGKILEPHMIHEFSVRTGRRVKREGRLLRSRSRPWQLCTLDARQTRTGARSPGSIEIKTTKFDWDLEVPAGVYAQVQHGFAVTGWEYGSVACWNRTSCEFDIWDVTPDAEYIGELNDTEEKFWRDCVQGIAPNPDGSDATARAIRALYPKPVEGQVIRLGAHFLDVTDDLELVKEEIRSSKTRQQELETELKAAIGDSEAGLLPNGVLYTLKLQTRPEYVVAATEFRVLRRKEAHIGRS